MQEYHYDIWKKICKGFYILVQYGFQKWLIFAKWYHTAAACILKFVGKEEHTFPLWSNEAVNFPRHSPWEASGLCWLDAALSCSCSGMQCGSSAHPFPCNRWLTWAHCLLPILCCFADLTILLFSHCYLIPLDVLPQALTSRQSWIRSSSGRRKQTVDLYFTFFSLSSLFY